MIRQEDFCAALLDPAMASPLTLTNGQNRPAGNRFDVYRNNVVMGLKEALAARFPVLQKVLGPGNFSQLAGVFLRAHPPSDPRVQVYGEALPSFLEGFAPLAHLPYLADIARLEIALTESYHEADSAPVAPDVFAQLGPDDLALCTITLAPSLRLVRSDWPLFDIWHFNMTPGAAQPGGHGQDTLALRPNFDPVLAALPPGGADLIDDFLAQTNLGVAFDRFETAHPDQDGTAVLSLLLQNGAITELCLPHPLNER